MPRRRILDSSDDEDAHFRLSPKALAEAGLEQALSSRHDYPRAVQELSALVRQGYPSRATKAAQEQLFDLSLLAVQLCNGLQGSAQALIGLLEACEAVLPQARRARLAREARKHAVARSRARQKSEGAASWDGDGMDLSSDVPDEVLRHILSLLSPLCLARAGASCRKWRQLAAEDELWRPHLARLPRGVRGTAAAAAVAGMPGARQQLSRILTEHPALACPWQSNRIWQDGSLAWLLSDALSARSPSPSHVFPSIQEVVNHLLREPAGEPSSSDSEGDLELVPSCHGKLWRANLVPQSKLIGPLRHVSNSF
eukprot:jgi/Astpho2/1780/fgenesh1_pg.00037_%23_3_t